MPPITKIWLFSLKDDHDITDPPFAELWDEILAFVNAFTRDEPGADDAEQHILFQCVNDSKQLVFITGYPSLEMNMEADREYAERFMKRMFAIVEHNRLLMVESDVMGLQLCDGKASMSLFKSRPVAEPHVLNNGIAGWDVWQPPGSPEPVRKETWIHVLPASDGDTTKAAVSGADSVWQLQRVKGANRLFGGLKNRRSFNNDDI